MLPGFGNVGVSLRHIARLEGVPIQNGLFAQSVLEQLNQAGQSDRLGFSQIENIVIKCLASARHDAVDDIVSVVIEHTRTGKSGDGRVLVIPIDEGYSIRTRQCGAA